VLYVYVIVSFVFFFSLFRRPLISTLFPYTTLFRSISVSQWLPDAPWPGSKEFDAEYFKRTNTHPAYHAMQAYTALQVAAQAIARDRKSTRLNSSHVKISYAVFCLKKKKHKKQEVQT